MWKRVTDLSGVEIITNLDNVITIVKANGGSKVRFVNGEEITIKEPPDALLMSKTVRSA